MRWFGLILTAALFAAQPPAFEVASVKPAKPEIPRRTPFVCGFSGSRFRAFGPLQWIIACAYEIHAARAGQEMIGGPSWLNADLFDIQATLPTDGAGPGQRLAMLRQLLADRFKLAVHDDTREMAQYHLVLARRDRRLGPQLRPTQPECAAWVDAGRRGPPPPPHGDVICGRSLVTAFAFRSAAMPLSQLATLLSPRVERPVIDQTGLAGNYEIDLQWRSEQAAPGADAADSLPTSVFTALREQLGLTLEPAKGPMRVLVIDHVERPIPE
jgi:uncharacterized protein (TIGR03435 family)